MFRCPSRKMYYGATLHLIWFIRDAALERLVSSLKYPPFYTRSVSYLSLIFWTNPYSLSLISYQQQKTANHSITISENECNAWGDIWVLNLIKFSYQSTMLCSNPSMSQYLTYSSSPSSYTTSSLTYQIASSVSYFADISHLLFLQGRLVRISKNLLKLN